MIIEKLKKIIDNIDPQTDGIVILLVGDVQIEFGITAIGNDKFDMKRLKNALDEEVERLEK